MSSLKKAIKQSQRVHRERAQPERRAHLGLLEKKKDYKKRAADYHEKNETINKLKKQALDRNPDEYHYHMSNSHVGEDGRHVEHQEKETEDTKLQKMLGSLKDLEYVKYHLQRERKKIDEMKSSLHMAEDVAGRQSKHTIFVEDEAEARNFDPVEYFSTDESALSRKFNRPLTSDLVTKKVTGATSKATVRAADKLRKVQYRELQKRMQREKELTVVVDKLQVKKNLASTNVADRDLKPKRVKKGTSKRAAVYKWTYVRKR